MTQIIICALSVLCVTAIALFYKKLPEKVAQAFTACFVFIFSDVLFINFSRPQITKLGSGNSDTATFVTILVLIAVTTAFSFLTVFLVKDAERRRKIFFSAAAFIFAAAYLKYTFDIINGTGAYPSHLCRQISYAFPAIYFSKRAGKILLPYFVYASIIGGVSTLFAPNNMLNEASLLHWSQFDTFLTHFAMLLTAAALLANKEVRPKLHDIWQFVVFLCFSALFAYTCNYIVFRQTGTWGNGMYLTEPAADMLPTWMLAVACITSAAVIILAFNIKTIMTYFKNGKKKNGRRHN